MNSSPFAPRRPTLLTVPALSGYQQPESAAPPPLHAPPDRRITVWFGAVLALIMLSLLLGALAPVRAEDKGPVLSPGDAVVTGFSGIKPPAGPVPPGKLALDGFFIDLDGPSAQILSLAAMGGPAGQLVTAPALRQLKASEIGQVFAIALDDGLGGKTPNIYLGATSAFGLHIVGPDKDGDGQPERLKKGEPGAEWMAGQFGPNEAGPGAIWKVDGATGEITLFATVPVNSGPGVGDIVFDKAHKQFFVSDLDTGFIHRIGETGEIVEGFDHGTSGRPAKGLPELGDDGRRAEIETAGFDVEDPSSWGFTQDDRMVWGLAIRDGRLFYAVAGGHQIWSIGIADDGRFAGDARWELDAGGLSGDGPITDMLFDGEGRLHLAQRGKARGSYDYSLFADPEKSSVVRYRREQPDNPATPGVWIEEPEEYAIGLPPEHRHADGGIALGFAHDETGNLRLGACGQTLWSTGHRLRPGAFVVGDVGDVSEKEAEAAKFDVHGLQGNDASLVRPQNVPPQQSYFIDYDGFFGDAEKAGHMGDVEIWQPCDGVPAQTFGQLPPGVFPPGDVPPDEGEPDWPGEDFNANLKLRKWADPKTCLPWVGGWLCRYTIRVTNTGPDNYFGPIYVNDWLPANPAGALMGFSPSPPWLCWVTGPTERRCRRLGVFLVPAGSVDLTAYVWVPKAKDRCHLRNVAEIHWPHGGTQWNSDPTDDADDANALIPDPDCKDRPKRTDLKIYKRALGPCFPWNGKLRCGYRVTVENRGPGAYNGDIEVVDVVPAGTTPIFSGVGWNCTAVAPYTCKYAGASLPNPGDSKSFIVRIDLTKTVANQLQCKIVNKVKITEAPSPSPMNTDPTNDTAEAVAIVPAKYCHHDQETDLTIYKRPLSCFRVDGHLRCGFRVRVVNLGPGAYNGDIEVRDFVPAGMTPHFSGAGWTCTAAAPYICKYAGANLPNPPSSLSFFVRIDFSSAQAKELNCKLRNKVEILEAAGGTPQNFDPDNDVANAVAVVPEEICGDHPRTNLKIEKKASPTFCSRSGNDWWCSYLIRVINTGPGFYHGSIKVEEALPAEPLDANWNAPWNCVGLGGGGGGAVCTHPNTDMAPLTTRILHLRVKFSGDVVKQKGCLLPNVAKITHAAPGSAQNTNPGDDIAGDTAKVPAEFCKPEPTNLKLEKYGAQQQCNTTGDGKWRCPYMIVIQNMGPGEYNGNIVVKDTLQPSAGGAKMEVPQNAWNCDDTTGPEINCTYPGAHLKLGDHLVFNVFAYIDPARFNGCSLRNTAKIVKAPGGSVQNANAGDDQMSATLQFPPLLSHGKAYCYSPEPIQPCPPGFSWVGGNCSRIGTFTPPPPPPVVDECPDGFVGTPPNCRRIPDGDPHCPQGTVGRYPNCRDDNPGSDPECTGGRVERYGKCVCPGQLVWNGKRCVRRECPDGMTGLFPRCYKTPECTGGRVERYGKCVCPGGLVWNGKRCVRRECPDGMTGKFPNCDKVPSCTGGRVKRGERCVCPGGLSWNGQRCVRRHCPSGMTGTPPNCHRIEKPKRCRPGLVGRPPFCHPPKRRESGNGGNGGKTFRPRHNSGRIFAPRNNFGGRNIR